ncbi:ectonucleotide pyrophosphatase/phosphodiesterase family member 7-like [Amphiura filiformis]|uniref:ectonucleotide pyrophosphatase/phosphodiesterase family member 7-like n=1 Tax=Amphiura filiformis TaxID=82378 RepID=UPI003B211B0D
MYRLTLSNEQTTLSRATAIQTILYKLSVNEYACIIFFVKKRVFLLILDGLRWDLFGEEMPALDSIATNGVRAEWMDPIWPTMSTPSMFSMVTGLYPESHGVLHNLAFDPVNKTISDGYLDTLNMTWWFNTGAEPMWVTVEKQGLKAGTYMYPGGNVPIDGIMSTKNMPHSRWARDEYNLTTRLDQVFEWFVEDNIDFACMQIEFPDNALHTFGIGKGPVLDNIKEVNDAVAHLLHRIEDTWLADELNLLIVSDHGHVEQDRDKHVALYDYIDDSDVDFVVADYGPIFLMVPVNGTLDQLYDTLVDAHPSLQVYKKEDFPERFHYANHPRALPLLGYVDANWNLCTTFKPILVTQSDHGYDNDIMVMKSVFYAQGPSFKKGYLAKHFESINIYQMMCDILDLEAKPNNGSRSSYSDMFEDGGGNGALILHGATNIWIMLLLSTMAYIVMNRDFWAN